MAQGIYKIEYDGCCAYVGCARDIQRRFSQHRSTLKRGTHRNYLLQRVWDKHGDVLSYILVEEVLDQGNLASREQHYIDTLRPWANISDARGSHPHTEETKLKMRGRVVSKDTRDKLSRAHAGKPNGRKGIKTGVTPSTSFKPGSIPWNKDTTGATTAWNKGVKLAPEHRAALSAAKKGKARPDIAEKLRGKKQSPEVIAKRVARFRQTIAARKDEYATN